MTGDVNFFFGAHPANTERLFRALRVFWSGEVPGISTSTELTVPGLIVQFGRPPNRIDLLNHIDGVAFDAAWAGRREVFLHIEEDAVPMYYIGLTELIANKQAAGRPKNLDDLRYLKRIDDSR